jgi:hypothetical protein
MSSKDIRDPIPAHVVTAEFTRRPHHIVVRFTTTGNEVHSYSLTVPEAAVIGAELTAWADGTKPRKTLD